MPAAADVAPVVLILVGLTDVTSVLPRDAAHNIKNKVATSLWNYQWHPGMVTTMLHHTDHL